MALRPTRHFSVENIRSLIQKTERDLKDSEVKGISPQRRFVILYEAGLDLALAFTLANRMEPDFTGGGHHRDVLDFLADGLKFTDAQRERGHQMRKLRNANTYIGVGDGTDQDLKDVAEWARRIVVETHAWFAENLPQAWPRS